MIRRFAALLALVSISAPALAGAPSVPGQALPRSIALQDSYARLSLKSDETFKAWRERSMRLNAAAFADTTATEFYEPWIGTASWTSATYQVSGGRAYSNSGSGSTAGLNHSFALASTDQARAIIPVNFIPLSGSANVIVGFSTDAAGATPASGGSSARGIYFQAQTINCWNGSALTQLASGLTSGTAIPGNVTITVDAAYISEVFTPTAGTTEYRCQFARSGNAVNNLYFYLGDSRNLTGSSIGPMIARRGMSTSTPSYGIEATYRNVQWTKVTSVSGGVNNVKIVTPPGYDSRYPYPAVIMFHGHGTDENLFSDNSVQQAAYTAFLNAGYVLISTACTAGVSSWGAQCSLDAYYAASKYARDHYNIGSIGFYANSMGGIESLLLLADRRIPGVSWWIGGSPTYSLADNYGSGQGFNTAIDTAYGAPYATTTGGHDPALMDARSFRGLPMKLYYAPDDTVVSYTNNALALAQAVGPYAPELNVVQVSSGIGAHSFNLTNYTASMIAFANKYAGN